jgi:hypothetical protein
MVETVQREPMYTNWAGYAQNEFSYTLASEMDKCGHFAKLTRIQGLTAIKESAAFKFGDCVEKAVCNHYASGGKMDAEADFNGRWQVFSKADLDFSSRDGDWNGMLIKGRAIIREFMKQKPNFPDMSKDTTFQEKLVLKDWAPRADLIYYADALKTDSKGKLLIDIKTAASSYPQDTDNYPDDPALRWLAMDPQLLTGCLVSGARRVAFMVFVKTKTPSIQWLEATVTQDRVDEISQWLRDQYEKLVAGKFYRRAGWRFPSTQCQWCDVSSACLGNKALAKTLLKTRESKAFEENFD